MLYKNHRFIAQIKEDESDTLTAAVFKLKGNLLSFSRIETIKSENLQGFLTKHHFEESNETIQVQSLSSAYGS